MGFLFGLGFELFSLWYLVWSAFGVGFGIERREEIICCAGQGALAAIMFKLCRPEEESDPLGKLPEIEDLYFLPIPA